MHITIQLEEEDSSVDLFKTYGVLLVGALGEVSEQAGSWEYGVAVCRNITSYRALPKWVFSRV